jgi:hypothetical protein
VGEIVDFVVDTARKPNPVLALSAAITVLGTLIGRRVAGPTLSGTHLYVVNLAPTGAGKDHPQNMASRLLHAAQAEHLVGPDEFMSHTALAQWLLKQPLSLCAMDEFGAFIAKISSATSIHEQNIGKILRTAWGRSFAAMRLPEWAWGRMKEFTKAHGIDDIDFVYAPALAILGASTPSEFFAALQARAPRRRHHDGLGTAIF